MPNLQMDGQMLPAADGRRLPKVVKKPQQKDKTATFVLEIRMVISEYQHKTITHEKGQTDF
ncbi:MAG TPA: hypothetical protein P5228_12370 [Bacteroidales bacterium]|nr:hypothetical protein [Bacteroidales bacterium]HRZ49489.1 hypothetical protein [Bacteroidales bacterium]